MKPTYRQSGIQNYFECPKKYELSLTFDMPASKAMKQGLLLEYLIGGMNPRAKRDYPSDADYLKEIKNGLGAVGLGEVQDISIQIPKFVKFLEKDNFFQEITAEFPEFNSAGEADYIGLVEVEFYNGEKKELECIADIKFTTDASIWLKKETSFDYLQAAFYPTIVFVATGKLLPFLYVIGEAKTKPPLIIPRLVYFFESDIKNLLRKVEIVHKDFMFRPKTGENTCIKGKYNRRCEYLNWCEAGRQYLSGDMEINYEDLLDPMPGGVK